MLIIDGDYPMSYSAIDLNRNLTRKLAEVRAAEPDRFAVPSNRDSETLATLPEMRLGGVAVALVKVTARIYREENSLWGYRSPEVAYAIAQGHLNYYRILEGRGEARILGTRSSLSDHLNRWLEADDREHLPVGFILGMEGADPILWPEQLDDWWKSGIRVISLSHYGVSTYCHGTGTGTTGGLLPPARRLLRKMEQLGVVLDVTHAADESVRQALELYSGPVLASHQNCRALAPGERQFPDELLQKVIERDGVIGVCMDNRMLYRQGLDWSAKVFPPCRELFTREAVTLEDFVNHIDHICQLAGNANHAAIGGDTDGQGGREAAPLEIDSVADYVKLADTLERRGYTREDIEKVMYRNWRDFFEKFLPVSDGSSVA